MFAITKQGDDVPLPTRLSAAKGAFQLNDRPSFLLSGEMHYFRVPRELWDQSLGRIRDLGITAISTYIPWTWHEPQEGFFDFTGETDPRRDLIGFIEACKEHGLPLLARPGPLIYAEFEGLGVPLWLGRDYPESVVLRRDGSMDRAAFYFNHSMLHNAYRTRVRRWYQAVIPVLQPFFEDPVISFQLDNETGLLYANRIGEVDFNPDTVKRYRAFLETRYGTIRSLNRRWNTKLTRFDGILPPRPPLQQPQIHDWQEFVELMICRYLAWLRDISLDLGVTVPLVHNEQGLHHSPRHVCDKTGLVSFTGYDLYPKASTGRHTQDFPFATSFYPGLFKAYAGDEHPLWASEMGTGWMDPRAKVSEEAITQNIFGSLAHGVRGINLFPIHDGREPGSNARYRFRTAINDRGQYNPRARTVEAAARFLGDHGERLVTCEEVFDPVAFGIYYPNFRFASEDYLSRSVFVDPHRYLAFLGQGGMHGLLLCAGFNPRMVDIGEMASEEDTRDLADARCLIWSNKGLVDERTYLMLEQWVAGGGHLVTTPVPPTRNMRGYAARYTPLFPVAPTQVKPIDRFLSYATMTAGVARYFLFQRSRLREEHLSSGHVIELYEPLLHLLSTPARGVDHEQPYGIPIPGDYLSASFDLETAPPDMTVEPGPLRRRKLDRGLASSYRVRHGEGSSTVLGTLVAGRYVTPRYYALDSEIREGLRNFIRGMLREWDIFPSYETGVEAEFVAHRAPDGGGYLFIINRLGRQTGRVQLERPEEWGYHGHLRIVFTLLGSGAVVVNPHTIEVDLFPQDVLVLSFPPA
jgi:hypothetical protein